ncbi:immunity 22 family protein [Pseudomonas capsici]|uniref:Immunity 22 family protein n=1 Tax=Pseudomonas capsici TaxID=2810614 RepID=A0ABT3C495_9PSED|nr:immunity 22 family protein [Pseudomonas capsici]MBN6717157.1 immunity 22 family protein [Pseudomonas capsici]MBN6722221.1 immunity 22 family protein [Pseudomonas capsici]MBN6727119.1 immunity 22 family protein [Pseudomonas capsici]MCV4270898.1 immunity 22 family protein [Pseudomonas capsici]MCV4281048.1 immunity 22 family protein [Pseudomonas capsici]
MSSKKSVSIWTANTGWDMPTLREVMSPEYSEDGDFLGSAFSKAFSLGFVDDDTVEADKIEPTKSLLKAIEGGSYDVDIMADMKGKNTTSTQDLIDTIIAVYDFSFSGAPQSSTVKNKIFTYRGSFEYNE